MDENIHAGHREKMRARFIHDKGFENFEDHQILELLLYYANTRSDTNPLAHELLDRFGSLKGVLEARPEQLMCQHDFACCAADKGMASLRDDCP